MNPLDELYAAAKERADGRFKVMTAAYVVDMIDKYKRHQTNEKAVLRRSNKKGV